ncbi:hypothetical protein CLV59_103659 [Chitinophaga dinghuensis]|uniref:Uncharacterized protein n=1 Tax=Chitinophaga dinghuensis TaxID=1539050 RepID=A0A327W3A0_9BACT|nr:hypothetical protein [Chitinophaga dinghuensis]RAJ83687.1 hypothetical protein CLV59_103659 [Chitinophaga dinghuensis]
MENKDQDAATLLQYTISTNPSPVNISSSTNAVTAQIIIQVAADQDVLCKYISIAIPVGDDSDDMYLISPIPTSSSDNDDWEISADIIHGMNDDDGNTQNFLYKHTSDDMTVSTGITFTIDGTVNSVSGTATIQIKEYSMGLDDDNYMIRQKSQDISKAAQETFFLNSVVLEYIDTPGVPVGLIDKSRGVQLTWQSNGDYFKVYAGSSPSPVYEGEGQSYVMPNGLTTDLAVIVEADKGGDVLYQEYVIKVNSPTLEVSRLDVDGPLMVNGIAYFGNNPLSNGPVSIFNNSHIFYQGANPPAVYYTPTSDGFVTIQVTSHSLPQAGLIQAQIFVSPNTSYMVSTFASLVSTTSNSLTLPVQMGVQFWIETGVVNGANTSWEFQYSWVALGQGDIKSTSMNRSEEAAEKSTDKIDREIKAYQYAQKQKAAEFITALEKAFDKVLTNDAKEELIEKYL